MRHTPGAAYRADMLHRTAPFGPDDEQWLAAATELHHAAAAPQLGQSRLYDAIGVAIDLLGDERIDAIVEREWPAPRTHVEAILVLCELIDRAGALHLCAVMLDDLLQAAPDLPSIDRGRILAMRARVTWKLGHRTEAIERYEFLESLGRKSRKPELVARAAIGLAAVAQLRGHYPEVREHAARAAKIADRDGLTGVARVAHQGLMLSAARSQRWDEALLEGWEVLRLSEGDAMLEAEILQNMGQLSLEAGHPASARACFAAVMERTPAARILLPALGGLALASARTGAEPTVEWSVREVWRARDVAVPKYEMAAALIESGTALVLVGRSAEAKRYLDAGAGIARAEQLHELELRAEQGGEVPAAAPARAVLTKRAARVASDLVALEPERLPDEVAFGAAAG